MKRRLLLPPVLAAAVLLSSCRTGNAGILPHMKEITDFEVVQVLGIDRADDGIEVTLVADRATSGGQNSSAEKITEILSFTDKTVAGALRNMGFYSDKSRHLGYVDFLLIGEEAAEDGITKYIDYFTRDYESRYSANVFVIRNGTAKDFLLQTTSETLPIDTALSGLEEATDELSITRLFRIIDLVSALGIPYQATVIPALECLALPNVEMVGGELPKMAYEPSGYAFLRDYRLIGYYEREHSPAYNTLVGTANGGVLVVTDPEDNLISLVIHPKKLNFTTTWDGDTLKSVKYEFRMYASLTEQLGIDDIYNEKSIDAIEVTVGKRLRDDIEAVIRQSQSLGQDGIELGERVRMKNPVRWARLGMDLKWRELFPAVKIDVDVTVKLRRTYDLREPTGLYKNELIEGKK